MNVIHHVLRAALYFAVSFQDDMIYGFTTLHFTADVNSYPRVYAAPSKLQSRSGLALPFQAWLRVHPCGMDPPAAKFHIATMP